MSKLIPHILIVEDDDLMRDELSHTFAEAGNGVSVAKTGEEALVIALQQFPELILLDILLPRMGGLEMLKELRMHEKGKNISILILSNLRDDGAIAEAIEVGGYDYLLKADWSLNDVLEKVNEKFNRTASS